MMYLLPHIRHLFMRADNITHLVIILCLTTIVVIQLFLKDDYSNALYLLAGYIGRGAIGATAKTIENGNGK